MARKLAFYLFVAFCIFMVAFRPDTSASIVKTAGGWLITFAQGFGDFLTSLVT